MYDKIVVEFLKFGWPINCNTTVLPKSTGSFYFHTTLPFGLRSTTMACQRTTKAVTHILNNHGILADVYIDDFYSAATPETSRTDFVCMNRIFSELGLQASPDKDIPPCCEMTCFGVQINTASMILTVPLFCLHELQEELNSWSNVQFCTRKDYSDSLASYHS